MYTCELYHYSQKYEITINYYALYATSQSRVFLIYPVSINETNKLLNLFNDNISINNLIIKNKGKVIYSIPEDTLLVPDLLNLEANDTNFIRFKFV